MRGYYVDHTKYPARPIGWALRGLRYIYCTPNTNNPHKETTTMIDLTKYRNHRERIKALVESERVTRTDLVRLLGVPSPTVYNTLHQLRLMGLYALERSDKTLYFGTAEDFLKSKSLKKVRRCGGSKEDLFKNYTRESRAEDAALKLYEDTGDMYHYLQAQIHEAKATMYQYQHKLLAGDSDDV